MAVKQQDGRYRAKVTVGKDINGKSIVKYVSGRTKKELEAAKEAVKQEYITGEAAPDTIVFGAYVKLWYETYKQPNVGASAQAVYKAAINKHILPVLGDKRLTAISNMDLQDLLNSKQGCSKATIRNIYHVLSSVLKKAYSEGIIQRDVTVGLVKPSYEKSSRRSLTEDEEAAAKVLMGEENGLLVALLYYTGMRIGEALGLQWDCVDFKSQKICVRQQVLLISGEIAAPKTPNSIRDIPMPDELRDMLLPLRGMPKTFVISSPSGSFYRNTPASQLWHRLMKRLYEISPCIETREDGETSILTPHYFRHNYASVLYNAGIDVLSAQRFLGHADVKTTLEIYSHLSRAKEDENAGIVKTLFSKRLPESCQKKSGK